MLSEFFAVTETSIYQVRVKGENGYPSAVKIALRGKSRCGVGQSLGSGTMIAVGRQIISYIPEKHPAVSQLTGIERNPNLINTGYWRGYTSSVVALFLEEKRAIECFNAPNPEPCDPRWIVETRQVLDAIGDNHPVFYVPTDKLALLPPIKRVVMGV